MSPILSDAPGKNVSLLFLSFPLAVVNREEPGAKALHWPEGALSVRKCPRGTSTPERWGERVDPAKA